MKTARTWAAAMVAVLLMTACGQPEYHYIRDRGGTTYFKVPASFTKLDSNPVDLFLSELHPDSEAARLRKERVWSTAFDQSSRPVLDHLLGSADPFVFATVHQLTVGQRDEMSLDRLRDFVFPYTEPVRKAYLTQQLSLGRMPRYIRFEPLDDQVLILGGGARGVHVRFNYQIGSDVQTYDQTAILDEQGSTVSVLIIACQAACYRKRGGEFDRIAQSFKLLRLPG
ncbi:hypothetical protein OIE66_11435 [Nonomuraea sp. NBC_01738]|uniref:hypothetical protein n=1 Tax=Nonomuraea sp. NBC_01738 TaxID=2976003 RepID=UPI002E15B609|nr:hypothetical protein OIE66_11435 [Nonomuraea sp. NBC_01738]